MSYDADRVAELEKLRDYSTRALYRATEAMAVLVAERDGARRERDTALARVEELTTAHAGVLHVARDAMARARDLAAELEGTRRELATVRAELAAKRIGGRTFTEWVEFVDQIVALHAARASNSGRTTASWTSAQVRAWCDRQTIEDGDAMDTTTWVEACEWDEFGRAEMELGEHVLAELIRHRTELHAIETRLARALDRARVNGAL